MATNAMEINPLFAEQSLNDVLHHLLKNYNGFQARDAAVRGGLSPTHMRKIKDFIQANLDKKLSLEELAAICELSTYHFARMFKLSFGQSPAHYITHCRINRIKLRLQTKESLALISTDCGFSQQSHMTKFFKKITGVTPAVYRSQLT